MARNNTRPARKGPGVRSSKGPRYYDWALIATTSPAYHLLTRRSLTPDVTGKRELAFFTCHAPAGTTLAELITVAGTRWAVEECFQAAKNETGLDHYQVRRYDAWYRHATLSVLALAFLQITASKRGTTGCGQLSRTRPLHDHHDPAGAADLIALTAGEIRRLLAAFAQPRHTGEHYQRWSRWRRRHQARARWSHYQRRLTNQMLPMRC